MEDEIIIYYNVDIQYLKLVPDGIYSFTVYPSDPVNKWYQ